ncbi:hypothetical protein [Streptomyces beigongshangae]|uniref:hypothetical protein n=1 Tax=Streptomyces beigongshangae TaxID=2841597 RepID=UPI001C858E57|nr:hypothetical protein [Streptomyces sp. REN17]
MASDSEDDGFKATLYASGPSTEGGRIPLAELARIASEMQATLERLALALNGSQIKAGRRPREIVDAVRLDFVGFERGSAVLQVARTGQRSWDDDGLLKQSFTTLARGVKALEQGEPLPEAFTPQVINGLRSLTGGIGAKGITRIRVASTGAPEFEFNSGLRKALRAVSLSLVESEATVVGRLQMGDFSPASLLCRIDTYAGSIQCGFGSEIRDRVLDCMDQLVMAHGIAEMQPDGSTIRVLRILDIGPIDSPSSRSLDDLAREQHVAPLASVDELSGGDIDGINDFLAAISSVRGDDR